MRIPQPPTPRPISRLSPTLYEAARTCTARAAWLASPERPDIPPNAAAFLGACFHELVASASRGELPGDNVDRLEAARQRFDSLAEARFRSSGWLLREKFAAKERLPFYFLLRERAAAQAVALWHSRTAPGSAPGGRKSGSDSGSAAEKMLLSRDGLLYGRPDLLRRADAEVVDFKTGASPVEGVASVSDAERRQLLIYGYLAGENGVEVRLGTIVRGDGQVASIALSQDEMQAEAEAARTALRAYNAAVESTQDFQLLATPSPGNCRGCPCIPFCEAFWAAATPEWAPSVGVHVGGIVEKVDEALVQGITVLSIALSNAEGTVSRGGEAVIEHIPVRWATGPEEAPIAVGDLMRGVHMRIDSGRGRVVLRAEKSATAIWRK